MFRINTAITFIVRISIFFFRILRSIIAARALGAGGKGILSLIYTSVGTAYTITESGISLSNVVFLGKRKYTEGELFVNSIVSAFILGGGVCIAVMVWLHYHHQVAMNIPVFFFYIAFAVLPLSLLSQYGATLFQGRHEMVAYNILKLVEPLVFFIVFFILVEVVRWGVAGAVYANAVAIIASCLVTIVFIVRISGLRLKFNGRVFGDALKFGLRGHVGNIGGFLNNRVDFFLVSYYTDIEYVGYYSIAVVVAEALFYIPNSLSTVMFPIIASSNRENISEFSAIVCRNTLFICLVLGLSLYAVAGFVVPLVFSIEFVYSVVPLRVLLPGVIALCVTKVVSSYFTGIGRPTLPSLISWVMLFINIPVNVLLIPKWGIIGAALASTFSYGIGMLISIFIFSELSKIRIRDLVLVRREDFHYYHEFIVNLLKKKIF